MNTDRNLGAFIFWVNSLDFENIQQNQQIRNFLEQLQRLLIRNYLRNPPELREPIAYRKTQALIAFLLSLFNDR